MTNTGSSNQHPTFLLSVMPIIVLIYTHFSKYGVINNDFQPLILITISWKHMCYNILWDILIYILCKSFQQRRINYIELIRSLL